MASVTIETNQRDAKLLALQRQRSQKTKPDVVTNSKLVAPDPSTARSTRGTEGRRLEQKSRRRVSGFDGAGIIQRSATTYRGAPRHVLLAPGGRILAYLQPDKNTNGGRGINLDRYLGRAMGVYGSRSFRADLQTDFILVRDLTPVRLRP